MTDTPKTGAAQGRELSLNLAGRFHLHQNDAYDIQAAIEAYADSVTADLRAQLRERERALAEARAALADALPWIQKQVNTAPSSADELEMRIMVLLTGAQGGAQ